MIEFPYSGKGLHEAILEYTRCEILRGKKSEEVFRTTWQLAKNKGRSPDGLRVEIDNAINGAVTWFAKYPNARLLANGSWHVRLRRWEYQDRPAERLGSIALTAKHWKADRDQKLIDGILRRRRFERLRPRKHLDIADLFAGYNFNVCVAREVNHPKIETLFHWRRSNLNEMQWMVPNPFVRRGSESGIKTLANVAERIWIIIEFDSMTLEEQSKLLVWLGATQIDWDLAMIVYSGGKSLHGWFSCAGKLEREIVKFFRLANSLGCDPMMRIAVQYTRLPLGLNAKTNREQSIWHWNQSAILLHNKQIEKAYEQ